MSLKVCTTYLGKFDQTWIYQLGKPWWSEWRKIFTHEGVLSQSLIHDKLSQYNYNLFKNEYVKGRMQRK